MSKTPELIALAGRIAGAHGLEPALVCAVIDQESVWNPWAVRYEEGFLRKYEARLLQQLRFSVSEEYSRAMSYGLMQVMGEVARELGFKGLYLTELCDPPVGIWYGCLKLTNAIALHGGGIADALLAYNGGADISYPEKVLALVPQYKFNGVTHI